MKRILPILALLGSSAGFAQPAPASGGLTLEQAVREAVEKNLDLAAERLNVPVAEARQITAALRPNPVVTLSGAQLNLLGADFSSVSPLGPNQLNMHTDLPLERGRKREQRIALARQDKSLAELGVRETLRQLIGSVQNAFVDVQQANNNLDLARENLATMERIAAINEARLRAGDAARVELDRSRVAVLQYRASVQQAQLQLDQAKLQLALLTGRKDATGLDVRRALRTGGATVNEEELLRQALSRRPDLALSAQQQARTRADLNLQLANGKMDYSVGAEVTRQWAYGFSGNTVGLSLSVPLPVFNRNQGEIARAQREIALAGARRAALEAAVRTETGKAFAQYTVARQLVASLESGMLTKAKSVRDTTEYSYKRGEASLIEFLDAQRAFNDAMQTFNDARAAYARSLYRIDTVSGATVAELQETR